MATLTHYRYHGLLVASAMLLPELAPFTELAPAGEADVHIELSEARAGAGELLASPEVVRFVVPEVAGYEVRAGCRIVVEMAAGAEAIEVRLFLLGTAWAVLCYQRELLPIHGAVVRVGASAVAFCGPSGAGKSTVAAWLHARGYALICDDLCRVKLSTAGPPLVWPSAPRSKLWRESLQALGYQHDGLERDYFRADKFLLPAQGKVSVEPVPLSAVYLLSWGEVGLDRLVGITALRRFVAASSYRPELLEPMGQLAGHWSRCAMLAGCTPIWSFCRPRSWTAMQAAMERLAESF